MKRRVLLVGAATLVGAEVFYELLQRNDIASIYLLLSSEEELRRTQVSRLEQYLASRIGSLPSHVEILAGNLFLPRFGLPHAMWDQLVSSIDLGFDCMERTTADRNNSRVRQINLRPVEGWIQMLELNPVLHLHFLSTAFIGGTRSGLLTEFDLDFGQGFHNDWERSCFDIETRLRESRASDRITIYRASHILGCAATGEAFEHGGSYPLLATLAYASVLPADAAARIDFVPADYVSAAMVALACSGASGVYHLGCGWEQSLSVNRAATLCARAAGRSRGALLVPRGVAWPLGIVGAAGRMTSRHRAFQMARELLHQGSVLDTYMSDCTLSDHGITCPLPETWLALAVTSAAARSWALPSAHDCGLPVEEASLPKVAAEFALLRRDPIFTTKRFQRVGEVNVAYRDIGSGEAVVFLHGFSGPHTWDTVVQRIAAGRRAIIIETLGLGDSEAQASSDFRLTAQAAHVRGLLSMLDVPAAHIVANGLGGAIAQFFAVRWPSAVKSLVLCDCDESSGWPPKHVRRLAGLAVFPGGMQLLSVLMHIPFIARSRKGFGGMVHDRRVLTQERLDLSIQLLVGDRKHRARLAQLLRCLRREDLDSLSHQLREIDVPTMMVWGAEDRYRSASWAKKLYDMIPGANRLELIPFAGSACQEEQPEVFAQLLEDFLGSVIEAKPIGRDRPASHHEIRRVTRAMERVP